MNDAEYWKARTKQEMARIEQLEAALLTILASTEEDAIPHIAYDGLTAYQALAKDIADCARAVLNQPGSRHE